MRTRRVTVIRLARWLLFRVRWSVTRRGSSRLKLPKRRTNGLGKSVLRTHTFDCNLVGFGWYMLGGCCCLVVFVDGVVGVD